MGLTADRELKAPGLCGVEALVEDSGFRSRFVRG